MTNQLKSVAAACLVICLSVIFVDVVNGGACNRIPHCNACTYDSNERRATCQECDFLHGATLVNGFSKCRNCSLDEDGTYTGCLKCKNFTKCDMCRFSTHGPHTDGTYGCSPCAANCRSCKILGAGKCDVCADGSKKIDDSTCKPCDIDNCRRCETGTGTCGSCKDGYYLENNQCTKCADNCKVCATATTCRTCKDFFFKEDGGTCTACSDSNCRTCNDMESCSYCSMGFYVGANKKSCEKCPDDCLACTGKDSCTACKKGKAIDGSCTVKCSEHCLQCLSAGNAKCDVCEDGYYQTKAKLCEPRNLKD